MKLLKHSKQHLMQAGEHYRKHQHVAFRYSLTCMKAGCMAFIHGIVPAWFETAASDTVKRLAEKGRNQT